MVEDKKTGDESTDPAKHPIHPVWRPHIPISPQRSTLRREALTGFFGRERHCLIISHPPGSSGFRRRGITATVMPVPETAVHEYYRAVFW